MLNTIPITPSKLFDCLDTLYRLRFPAYLAGPPGIGKSAVIRQFAQDRDLRLITLMLSQIEPSDLRGLPFLDKETGRTRWLLPEFYPASDEESAGILFLDELANAEPRVQVAAYQLLLDRRVGEYTLPPGWVCFAAGNRLEDNANVYDTPVSRQLKRPVQCYVCKTNYTELHFFYHLLCPTCARFNYAKREQRADLTGRVALVTGGRIKIGYQTALRMLRDGARVLR